VVTEAGTARTLTSEDAGSYIRCTNAAAVAITVPAGWGVVGDTVIIVQAGAGVVTLTGSGGLTINKPTSKEAKTAEQYAALSLVAVSSAVADLFGELGDA
jgi:hypothetical protein